MSLSSLTLFWRPCASYAERAAARLGHALWYWTPTVKKLEEHGGFVLFWGGMLGLSCDNATVFLKNWWLPLWFLPAGAAGERPACLGLRWGLQFPKVLAFLHQLEMLHLLLFFFLGGGGANHRPGCLPQPCTGERNERASGLVCVFWMKLYMAYNKKCSLETSFKSICQNLELRFIWKIQK